MDTYNKKELKFELLNSFEFNSDRKRMSVIVKDLQRENKIFLFSKGADSVILKLSIMDQKRKNEVENQLTEYSNFGLRTLVLA